MKKYAMFLDDYRQPLDCFGYVHLYGIRPDLYTTNEWVIVRNYDEFVKYIEENGLPEMISFDHDLAEIHYAPENQYHRYDEWLAEQNCTEKTGMDCAKWLVDYCEDNNLDLPLYYVHSMNPWGRKNINGYLENYLKFKDQESNSENE